MTDSQPKEKMSKERQLVAVRRVSILVFYLLLVGGIALISMGVMTKLYLYLTDGAVILVTSPIFFVIGFIAKRMLKEHTDCDTTTSHA